MHRIQRQTIRENRNNMWIRFCGGVRLKDLTAPGTFSRQAGGSFIKAASVQTTLKSLLSHPVTSGLPGNQEPPPHHSHCFPYDLHSILPTLDQILQNDDSTSKVLTAFIMINTEPVWNLYKWLDQRLLML